ncbi:glutathione Stransferase [Seminavis robusta]|uniref:Glutathione Stransferase n=1 Tax=Seminavis robusta TaxID=568900 RepID=A0A9N8EEA0_9STRA|nr:glutathione Stransferase [Seminavis robusta]|eukprot:Sro873_g214040.1 glutathione Stransferase (420) ;mRNA; r:20542-21801
MAPFVTAGWIWLASLVVPTWENLESKLPSTPAPVFFDFLPDDFSLENRPVLFRDKNGICPLSEQAWLGLEVKNIDYVTVLVDSDESNDQWCSPLRLQWPNGDVQTDALEILERLEQEYPSSNGYTPHYYPPLSKAVDSVRCNIVRFKGVFPRYIQPNVYAPYLIRHRNPTDAPSWVPESDHMVTLEETDEVMEEYYQGPFLCGAHITAADIVWAPFLERYAAQLPLVYDGDDLTPRSSEYETLKEWYEAMEEQVPSYACRVMGDKATWERLLQFGVQQGLTPPIDALLPSRGSAIPTNRRNFNADAVWKEYASTRPHVAESPTLECVSHYVRNRESIVTNAAQVLTNMSPEEIEQALREVLGALLEGGDDVVSKLSGNARELTSHLNEQLCVPRDMGVLPAAKLRTLAAAAPKPRIASR